MNSGRLWHWVARWTLQEVAVGEPTGEVMIPGLKTSG